jgi:hypothetical protein
MSATEQQIIQSIQTDVQEVQKLLQTGRVMTLALRGVIEKRLADQIKVLAAGEYDLKLAFYGLPIKARVEVHYGDRGTHGKFSAFDLKYDPNLAMENTTLAEFVFDGLGNVTGDGHPRLTSENFALHFLDEVFQKLREKKTVLLPGFRSEAW